MQRWRIPTTAVIINDAILPVFNGWVARYTLIFAEVGLNSTVDILKNNNNNNNKTTGIFNGSQGKENRGRGE